MLVEQLEALGALADVKTMGAAGTRLRISQSAVSKRISALEDQLELKLVQRRGRYAELTPEGKRLLERALPLIAELRATLSEDAIETGGRLAIGVSDSVLASFGARAFSRVKEALPDLELELHAHRSPVAIDRVGSGEYSLALCAGLPSAAPALLYEKVCDEPMVVVPSGLERLRRRGTLEVLTLETTSETWKSIAAGAKALRIEPTQTVENAFAAAQMAVAGLGHGLVPIGVVRALGIDLGRCRTLRLTRPIALVARKSTFARPLVSRMVALLTEAIAQGSGG